MKQVIFKADERFVDMMDRVAREYAELHGAKENRSAFIRSAILHYCNEVEQRKAKLEAMYE